jgi:hypothetical protein
MTEYPGDGSPDLRKRFPEVANCTTKVANRMTVFRAVIQCSYQNDAWFLKWKRRG